MKVRLLFLTLLFSVLGWGQTVSYTAFTTITCPATPTATISPAVPGLTFTQISRGAGVTCGAAGGSISGSAFNGTLAANITASKWYTYDVTSDATVSFNVSSLNIVSRVSNITGSPSVSVQFSIGGGAKTVIGSFTPTTTATTYTLPTAIAVGASQTLNIFIIPNTLTAAGTTCRVENNTSITLTTTPSGPAPEINVTGNGNTILTGDVLPTTTDFTDFGNVNIGSSVADSFVVENTGTANLTVSSVVISGANASDFVVTTSPVGTIASAGNSGLEITFTPSALGLRNATVTINNNDSNEAAYTFAIVGNGTCVPPANPTGSITVSANPSCGPATLSYPAGSYWQTTAGGTSTASPTSGTYPVSVTGTTVYVRNFNGTCWSTGAINSGAITINTPVAITTQPVASVIFSGSNTTFSVAATGTGLSYQWQVDTGSGFTNLTNVAPYSNVTTTTMNITAATVGMNGYLYRCVVSGAAPCASVNSNSALLTVTLYVPAGTVLKPGDLVFVGYDSTSTASCAGAEDKFYVASLVDILPGTQFLVVNSRYESGAAANVRTDKWYSGGSAPFDDPGIITFTWGGATSIPKGSIISFRADALVISEIKIDDVLAPSLTFTTNLNQCNISSSDPDQIYLMQGLFTPFGTVGTTRYNTFIGRVLYGLTNGVSWVPFSSAVSAGTTGGATRESRLPDDIECFNIESTSLNGVRFYNNSSLHTGTKYQLLSALINVGNWTIPANTNCLNVVEDFTGVTGVAVGKPFVITLGNPDGTWTGAVDTDWFKCANWEGLSVPKSTDDVIIPAAPVNQPIIGASPLKYPIGAFSNNLTLDSGSTLGMPNTLSRLNLYSNWTNNAGNVGFVEGLGTVYFEGSTPQIINGVTPEGTETFYNLILNNNFTTSISNNIIAGGNLTVGAGKTLIVSPNDYVQVTNNITNNGTFNVLNNGSLVQINDAGVNTGNISYERIASVKLQDYVYWSSPVTGFDVNSISP
ncbi:choice-of-anchor D domain-containing protein, partial [Flavobacterium sp.]|uniref:choice-of-anchor D domain-containing protein n=1 Tax=Flavobacterium sp. TaxID=239 RepID=UPI0038FC608C